MLLEQKVSLDCDHVNFTSCDQCVLNLLHPNLMQVEENNPALHRIQQILRQFKQAIDQEGVISLTINGQVQFMTQQAQQLLGQYCSFCSPTSLPDPLNHWFKQQISQLVSIFISELWSHG